MDIPSGTGFTTGKSFPGALPIGTLFVVPRDARAFAASRVLELYANGRLRQRARADAMVWDLDAILAHAWAWRDRRWAHAGGAVGLLPDGAGAIPARPLILAGTPHGTVFDGLAARHYARGVGRWLLGGWGTPVAGHVVAAYLADAHAAGAYLQPGDRVELRADGLGVVRSVGGD